MPPIRGQQELCLVLGLKLLAALLRVFSCVLGLKVWAIVLGTVSEGRQEDHVSPSVFQGSLISNLSCKLHSHFCS